MRVFVETEIGAPLMDVWRLVTDIENAASTIKAIQKIEILERPSSGGVGLKWRETRTMFGKAATEVMWVTDAVEGAHYDTRAESHGSIYKTRIALEDRNGRTRLVMTFEGEPQSVGFQDHVGPDRLPVQGGDQEGAREGPRGHQSRPRAKGRRLSRVLAGRRRLLGGLRVLCGLDNAG